MDYEQQQLWSEEMSDISLWVERLRELAQGIFRDMWSSHDLQDLELSKESLEQTLSTWRSLVEHEVSPLNIARRRMQSLSSTAVGTQEAKAGVLTWLRWWSLYRAVLLLERYVIVTANLLSSTPGELSDLSDILPNLVIFQLALYGDGGGLDRESQETRMQSLRDCVMEESLGFPMSHLSGLMESAQTPEELFSMSLTGRLAWPTSSRYWTDILSRCQSREDSWNFEHGGFLSPASFVLFLIMEDMDSGLLFADDLETMDNASSTLL